MIKRYWKLAAVTTLCTGLVTTGTASAYAQRGGGRGGVAAPSSIRPGAASTFGPSATTPTTNTSGTNTGTFAPGSAANNGVPGAAPANTGTFGPGTLYPPGYPLGSGPGSGTGLGSSPSLPLPSTGFNPSIVPIQSPNTTTGITGMPILPGQTNPGLNIAPYNLNPGYPGQLTPGLGVMSGSFNPYLNNLNPVGAFGAIGSVASYPPYAYSNAPQANASNPQQQLPYYAPVQQPVDMSGYLRISVPEGAHLFLNGEEVKVTGREYLYRSPQLQIGDFQSVDVKVTWRDSSEEVSREQRVILVGGDHKGVLFLGKPRETPKTPDSK